MASTTSTRQQLDEVSTILDARKFLSDPSLEFLDGGLGHFVDGEVLAASGPTTTRVVDPATGQLIAEVPCAGADDVDRAVGAAHAAFTSGPWRTMSASDRGRILARFASLVESHGDELAEIESLDNGKPLKIAKVVDVPLTMKYLDYFAGWPTKAESAVVPVDQREMFVYTRNEPLGVCGQIIPWNFPLLMAAWAIAAPLAAGCTVVLKPAEQTPLVAIRLAQLGLEAGMPPGVLNVILGDGTTGAALVKHRLVRKVHFTGSTPVGREIAAECARQLKPVTLELGGKSANILLPDADIDAAVKGSFQGIYYNSGQACNAGSRLYVPRANYDEVVEALANRASRVRLGHGLDDSTQFGPLISERQKNTVMDYIDKGLSEGAELVAGGESVGEEGYFVQPTLFSVTSDDLTIAREEIFGPVLVVSPYDSVDDAIARANDSEFGLAAGVWTQNFSDAHTTAAKLQAGSVYINVWGPSDAAAPFGGYKDSGLGRIHGKEGLDAYFETKTVWANLRK